MLPHDSRFAAVMAPHESPPNASPTFVGLAQGTIYAFSRKVLPT